MCIRVAILLVCSLCPLGCNRAPTPSVAPPIATPPAKVEVAEASREQVEHFCAACHLLPSPESFPKHRWEEEVEQGYRFYDQSAMKLKVPPLPAVVKWYENRAPAELALVRHEPPATPAPFKFEKITFPNPNAGSPPAISNVRFAKLTGGKTLDLLVCEMQRGQILCLDPLDPTKPPVVLSTAVANPAHVEVVDLDGDGIKDLLVADLGDFFPSDRGVGKVHWLRGQPDGSFKPFTLLDKVGRVADVQAADFNGDGKLDLVVAAFGWNQIGDIIYLENQTTDWNQPKFAARILDKRHGGIHVPIADLNGDGKPDFVALISQENEVVVAFLNDGKGGFTPHTIFQGPDPAFGSSGIQLVDVDGDGKLDVLYCNGDTMDRKMLRPYHGIHVLHNPGTFPFEAKRLTSMYGVHRALAADFLGKGQLDIVAVALLPEPHYVEMRTRHQLDAIIMLEKQGSGQYARHSLERLSADHATADAADFDGDGRADFVTASFTPTGARRALGENVPDSQVKEWVTVWHNVSGKRK